MISQYWLGRKYPSSVKINNQIENIAVFILMIIALIVDNQINCFVY